MWPILEGSGTLSGLRKREAKSLRIFYDGIVRHTTDTKNSQQLDYAVIQSLIRFQ